MSFLASPRGQQWIAFAVVAAFSAWILWRIFVRLIAPPLAEFLLKRGRVKLAMKLKHLGRKNCCE